MGLNFDVIEFCRKLKASRQPPYQCPVVECAKVYRSMCGLQYHLVNYDHDNPNPEPHTPGRKRSKNSSNSTPSGPNSSGKNASPPREALSFEESQRLVQVEVDGRVTRIPIQQDLPYAQPYKDNPEPVTERVPLPEAGFTLMETYDIPDAPARPTSYIRFIERSSEEQDAEVEYDMDEEDAIWLNLINEQREENGLPSVPPDMFELLMDRLEKESYFQMQCCTKKNNTTNNSSNEDGTDDGGVSGAFGFSNGMNVLDEDAVCCICMDGECQNSNVILFCDMCNLAVHQDCYGVPYIPEGPWLCRRCLQSPSRGVDCVLCPNSGSGAFKQTDRLHWAHVVCALWIPEVRFANTVFLEPIDSIEAIPAARWKLTCYLCKQRGVGACIQCHRSNCYQAFHVTCAQHAGLYMKMDTVRDQGGPGQVMVQKTAFCDAHTPSDAEHRPRGQHLQALQNSLGIGRNDSTGNDLSPNSDEARDAKMKKARKILAKKRASVPVISLPTIPPERIQEIASLVNLPKKSQLLHRLVAFWTCKRQYRNGVPLLRRLQSSQQSTARRDQNSAHSVDIAELYRQLKYWQCLRQDLERARLLCELVRKREKLKKEFTKIKELWTCAQLLPITVFLRKLLELIEAKDTGEIFTEPVDLKAVPDYLEVVDEPMDLSTMSEKISRGEYRDFDSFHRDFDLMINNCTSYNSEDTIFYKAGVRMREQCGSLLRQAKKDLLTQGWDPGTGLFIPGGSARSASSPPKTVSSIDTNETTADTGAKIDADLNDVIKNGEKMSSSTRLAKLLELLDRTHALTSSKANGRRIRAIKMEISRVRRGRGGNTSDGEVKSSGGSNHHPSTDSEREDSTDEDSKPLAQKLLKTPPKTKQEKDKTAEKKILASNSVNNGSRRKNKRKRKISNNKSPYGNSTSPNSHGSSIKIRRNTNNNSGNQSDSRSELTDPGTGPETDGSNCVSYLNNVRVGSGGGSLANSLSSSSGNNSEVHTPAKHSPNASPNSTSSSGLTPAQQAQTVSPSGVNRRTAVLFTRKAQAQGRLSTTAIQTLNTPSATTTSAPSSTNSINTPNSKIAGLITATLDNRAETPSPRMISNVSSISTPKEISSVNSIVSMGTPLGLLSSPTSTTSKTPSKESTSLSSTSTRRRVGRPRKNTLHQKKHSRQSKDANTTLGGSTLDPPVETPLSESFRVYRTANEIVVDSDIDESMSESLSSCSECSSTSDDSSEESGSHDDEGEEATSEASGEISSSSSNHEVINKRQISLASSSTNTTITTSNLVSISGTNSTPPATNTQTSPVVTTPNSIISTSNSSPATNKEKVSKKDSKSSIKSETSSPADHDDSNDLLEPLSMVWAKSRGYPSYPALIIDPAISKDYMYLGSIPIPAPPSDVLALRSRHQDDVYLVLFFDAKRTWQWLPRNKLERFSLSKERDQSKLLESRKPQTRKAVQRAFDHAMNYKQQVADSMKKSQDEKKLNKSAHM